MSNSDLTTADLRNLKRFSNLGILHWAIILLSLVLTIIAYLISSKHIAEKNKIKFDLEVTKAKDLLIDRLQRYEDGLRGGLGLYNSSEEVSFEEWKNYAETIKIDDRYPGVNGIGIINRVFDKDVESYLSEQQKVHSPSFKIHPFEKRNVYMPISFVLPKAGNEQAYGLDMMFEVNRRTAALKAIKTGIPQITGPIVLVQDAARTAGFLFYLPFYDTKNTPQTEQLRNKHFQGFIYSPFVFKNLMNGILDKDQRKVLIKVTDNGETLLDEIKVHDSKSFRDKTENFNVLHEVNLYGRTWQIKVVANNQFLSDTESYQPITILLGGVFVDIVLFIIFFMMGAKNKKAINYATALNEDLINKTKKLEKSNNDLEKFAYIASHDLKSPLRNIDALANMISDDLEGKMDKDTQDLFLKLRNKVYWMENLLNDLLDYSKLSSADLKETDIDLTEEVYNTVGLYSDEFEVNCVFNSHLPQIKTSAFAIRLILRNLIDNALKHNDKSFSELHFFYFLDNTHHILYLEDNGPGIPEISRDQVFEMFKTLKSKKKTPGSGMGLAFIKKVCDELDWEVKVTFSEALGGAKFIIKIPIT